MNPQEYENEWKRKKFINTLTMIGSKGKIERVNKILAGRKTLTTEQIKEKLNKIDKIFF